MVPLRRYSLAVGSLLLAVVIRPGLAAGSWTLCGDNKMKNVADEDEATQRLARPIGLYRVTSPDGIDENCTGTLIDRDLFLTARHCLGDCERVSVTFGFTKRSADTYRCEEIVEKGGEGKNQDYLIVRLRGNPGQRWGWHTLSDAKLQMDQPLLVIHHPLGAPMKVSRAGCLFKGESDGMLRHRCDTNQGSSGAAILAADPEHPEHAHIVGIHTQGGCDRTPDSFNSGPSITQLEKLSQTLRSLAP